MAQQVVVTGCEWPVAHLLLERTSRNIRDGHAFDAISGHGDILRHDIYTSIVC